jgi:hypothetical protein
VVALPELPRTSSGKLDRRALPPPGPDRPSLNTGYVAPRSAAERLVGRLWCTVLGLESVGAHDNFFDLGGHSALLLRLRAQFAAATGVGVGVVDLFRYPTVAAQARLLTGARDTGVPPAPTVATGRSRLEERRRRLSS